MVNLTKIFLAMMIGALFFVSFNIALGDFIGTDNYNVTVDPGFQDDLDNFTQSFDIIADKSSELQNKTKGTEASQDNTFGVNLDSALSAIGLVWDSFGITKNMISIMEQRLGIPSVFTYALITAMVITITFIVLAAVLRNPI